jgi:hypothetical protein
MTAVELLPPAEAVHGNERWYELRRAGVTASEIAALMGISPYESPFNLYWSKVNDWRWDGNEYTSAGRHLEDAIADWWMATAATRSRTFVGSGPGCTRTLTGRGSSPRRTGCSTCRAERAGAADSPARERCRVLPLACRRRSCRSCRRSARAARVQVGGVLLGRLG